ncbi:MAG: DUF4159 domain-containing protein [Deltaproteobacteria bacterium]|nr:DUF4159 domain-containing protein [Deltaproteobacteria bacterium]
MKRRDFIRILPYSLLLAGGFTPKRAETSQAQEKSRATQQFVFAQLKYRGGDWNPHPLAVTPLMEELMQRTSVEAALSRHEVSLTERDLFSYPFLYMTGKYDFEPFTQEELDILRRFLSYGGFLLADDALGQPGYGFDRSLRREVKRLFPEKEFRRLPSGHAALRSYYLLRRVGGMRLVHSYLEGIYVGNATPVIYCHNDLSGAWERDQLGNWLNPCAPGGEEQRRDAFHLGINLILYAMTENYKEDLIHVPFIRRRLSR